MIDIRIVLTSRPVSLLIIHYHNVSHLDMRTLSHVTLLSYIITTSVTWTCDIITCHTTIIHYHYVSHLDMRHYHMLHYDHTLSQRQSPEHATLSHVALRSHIITCHQMHVKQMITEVGIWKSKTSIQSFFQSRPKRRRMLFTVICRLKHTIH